MKRGCPDRNLSLAAMLFSMLVVGTGCYAEPTEVPSPKSVIYPGEIIRDDMLISIPADDLDVAIAPVAEARRAIIGKSARRTLLPGEPIGPSDVGSPRVVTNGAEITLVYVEDGLTISTSASALQDGTAGEVIRVRNNDSGVIISGVVQPDGSVRVFGGG